MITINSEIGWSNHWRYAYISVDDQLIIRSWRASNILEKAYTMADEKSTTVKTAIVHILNDNLIHRGSYEVLR